MTVDSGPIRPQAIFLHGGWRCGSTYLWNKFRELRDVTAFCEPFSEKLASCSPEDIRNDVPAAWDSRHPALAEPYFAEYLPLIRERGVQLYRDSFALQRYFVGRDEPLFERNYLSMLIAHASSRITLCSGFRAPWGACARSSRCSVDFTLC